MLMFSALDLIDS